MQERIESADTGDSFYTTEAIQKNARVKDGVMVTVRGVVEDRLRDVVRDGVGV